MGEAGIFTNFDDFLKTYLPNYYEEMIYERKNNKELSPEEAGRKLA